MGLRVSGHIQNDCQTSEPRVHVITKALCVAQGANRLVLVLAKHDLDALCRRSKVLKMIRLFLVSLDQRFYGSKLSCWIIYSERWQRGPRMIARVVWLKPASQGG